MRACLKTLGVDLDPRGNVRANTADYQTSRPNVFSAGDMRRGQSLVVWAIREGRLCARADRSVPDGDDEPAAVVLCPLRVSEYRSQLVIRGLDPRIDQSSEESPSEEAGLPGQVSVLDRSPSPAMTGARPHQTI